MYKGNNCYSEALKDSLDLFDNRVFKMMEHNLFITDYSKKNALTLHLNAQENIKSLEDLLIGV